MSFPDGIVSATRSAMGIPASNDGSRQGKPKPASSRRTPAAGSTTIFERFDPAKSGVAGRSSGPTLVERLRTIRPPGTLPATSGSVPPHLLAGSAQAPPTDSTPVGGGATTTSTAKARVFDATSRYEYGTTDNLASNDAASAAARNVQHGIDYYARTFGRDGIDGAGTGVDVLIDDRSLDSTGSERFAGNGGYFATPQADGSIREAIHFGAGKAYQAKNGLVSQYAMQHADDLAIHELTHGVIRKETGHLGGEADEAGATNEALADVMAAAATRDWRIGEGMYGPDSDYKLMRNIARPDDSSAIHGLYTSMSEVRAQQQSGKELEEHWASGVISTAAQRAQSRIGNDAGWQAVERVFYDTIDNDRLGDMSFASVAGALRSSAATLYGSGSAVERVFDEELRRSGL